MRIMIVDPSERIRAMVRETVCREHDVVSEHSNGLLASAEYGLFHPDVVLMEFEEMDVDDISAAERILILHPGARIIFITNFTSAAFRLKALQLNAAGFVSKERLSDLQLLLGR